jgi:Icc-related predicted phosphoesterase
MKIVCISDVHERWHKLVIPECDILISAGDYSFRGEKHIVKEFHKWLDKQDARYVISVQGNHELWVEENFLEAKQIAQEACPGVYFIDEGPIEIEGIKIYGSAITPFFCNWAWNRHPQEITKHWNRIPDDTQILITHGPSYNILDKTCYATGEERPEPLGCYQLVKRIEQLKDLDLHFCGHIHHSHGQKHIDGVSYYNASICDESYYPSNPITVVEYEVE